MMKRRAARQATKLLGQLTEPAWRSVPCLFVLSTGRTGTDTLRHLLALSPRVEAFHEPRPQLRAERKDARVAVHTHASTYWRTFAQARGAKLLAATRAGKLYAETSARLTFFAPVLAAKMPNARFVFIHRDPTAIIRSGMRRGWYVQHPADPDRIEPVLGEEGHAAWESWAPFAKICWYWSAYNRFALDFAEAADPGRVLTINADGLFSGTAVPDIFELIGIPTPADSEIARVLGQRHNAQHNAFYPPPDEWSDEQHATLQRIAGATMARLGYQSSRSPASVTVRSE